MSAEIIRLADVRAKRENAGGHPGAAPIQPESASGAEAAARFHFWTGASGKRYVHTVYSVFDCPPLEAANYVLVRRQSRTHRSLLAIGRLSNEAASLNLAEIRQRAAVLGADEVHIHLLATSANEAQAVEVDLRSAQFQALSV